MRTQASVSSAKTAPVPMAPRAPRKPASRPVAYRVAQRYDGFHVGQVVYQFEGPTYGVDVPGEIAVTVAPHQGPFVGLRPEFLERVGAH